MLTDVTNDDVFKIDTKGTCFLCLSPENCNEGVDNSSSVDGFKELLRYLNVGNKDLVNSTSDGYEDSTETDKQDVNVVITMCSSCQSKTENFNNLFQNYEKIRLQLDNCVRSVYQSMKKGDDSPQLVEQFKKKIKPKSIQDSINFGLATNLRRLTVNKCVDKLKNSDSKTSANSPKTAVPSSSTIQRHVCHVIVMNDDNIDMPIQALPDPTSSTDDDESTPMKDVVSSLLSSDHVQCVCKFCSKRFSRKSLLSFHQTVTHADHLMFPDLSLHFDTVPKVKTVLDQIFAKFDTSDKNNLKCPVNSCYKTFMSNATRKFHVVSSHKPELIKWLEEYAPKNKQTKKEVECEICHRKFQTRITYFRHSVLAHPEQNVRKQLSSCVVTLTDKECKEKIFRVLSAMKVQRSNQGRRVICPHCSEQPASKSALQQHMISVHPKIIAEEIEKNLEIESHENSVVTDAPADDPDKIPELAGEMQHKCDECEATFFSKANLTSHTLEKHLTCRLCGLSFMQGITSLRNHVLMDHTLDAVLPYMESGDCKKQCELAVKTVIDNILKLNNRCVYCGQQFSLHVRFKQHFITEHFSEFVDEVKMIFSQSKRNGEVELIDLDDD